MINKGYLEEGNLGNLAKKLLYEIPKNDIDEEYYNQVRDTIKELKDKNMRQENFLLNISHDLRAHLNVILSVMQCIDYGNVNVMDKKALEYMGLVKRNSLKMLKLINNLIDTTKFENNYYMLNKRNIDIISMVEGTVGCVDKYAKQKNIQLVFDTNEEECIMAVDPELIDRIVMNLISNAIKFSPKDSNIYINIFVEDENINISVRDEGPGISKESREKIFDRFYQISQKSNRENGGSGIGLDLVNYLTKAHDGKVTLNSEEGKGSEFIVTLPICRLVEVDEDRPLNRSDKIQMLEIEFSDIYLI
ncbi:hypothetical protein JCM1393_11720 [Clostridium carnis]